MKAWKTWAAEAVAAVTMVVLAGTAQAGLIDLLDGTVKDTNTNLIWLKDWNVNGQRDWATQKAWAETTLDGFAGSNDWVLPSISQLGDLYTAYGNLTLVSQFSNVQSNNYWSGTEISIPNIAKYIDAFGGKQREAFMSDSLFAVAVRTGDVTASVPEPQTLALALLAVGATVVVRSRRSR